MARHEQPPASRATRFRAALKNLLLIAPAFWAYGWGSVAGLALTIAIGELLTGSPDAVDDLYAALGFAVLAAPGALVALWQLRRERRQAPEPTLAYRRPELPSIPPPRVRVEKRHRLPQPGSAARQPVRQLAEAESALAQVLRQLDETVPERMREHTWHTATDTVTRLRAVAARLEAVELAAKHAPPGERAALEDGAGGLLTHLQQGLETYRGLVAAAGRVVLATTPAPATDELVEATERLAALAEALDELATKPRLAGAERETRGTLEDDDGPR
jgi:hypothetical protein